MLQFMSGTRVLIDPDALDAIGEEAAALGSRALVVTDRGVAASGVVDLVTSGLRARGIEREVFDGVASNPSADDVAAGAAAQQSAGADIIVAVGGGSPLDAGKAIGLVATNGGTAVDLEGVDNFEHDPLPLIAVPTTIGTGSEVTMGSVIVNPATHAKMVIVSRRLYPRVAILDKRAVAGLPGKIAAATGIDALTHAIEGYVAKGASELSDALNLRAVAMIGDSLRPAVDGDADALYRMLVASCTAGAGFHNAGLGLAHALANTVQSHFEVHHGAACGVFLPHVVGFNVPAATTKLARVHRELGFNGDGGDETAAAADLAPRIRALMDEISAPRTVRELGVDAPEPLDGMAEEATRHFDWAPNPRRSDAAELQTLFEEAWN